MRTLNINKTALWLYFASLVIAGFGSVVHAENVPNVSYRTITVEDVDIFYREAGDPNNPTILLLHGFPTSSHMFRDLIPELVHPNFVDELADEARHIVERVVEFIDGRHRTEAVARIIRRHQVKLVGKLRDQVPKHV